MARLEIAYEDTDAELGSVECLEVRPWGVTGTPHQHFYIGSGLNFNAAATIWLEIRYTVGGSPLVYSRNFLHYDGDETETPRTEQALEQFASGAVDSFTLVGMFPETCLRLSRQTHTYTDQTGSPRTSHHYRLEVDLDLGPVFGGTGPGGRTLAFEIDLSSPEQGVAFMRDLVQEIDATYRGDSPDPGHLPPGASDWPFARQLNQRAYDGLAASYQEYYFDKPALTALFDAWLQELPRGARILDAGCGHGQPVTARLLELGYRVTGADVSPHMLARARKSFPELELVNRLASELDDVGEFDGVCSFSSLLYLDPIDLAHSLYRIHQALKPGGRLLLFAYDLHPGWRGLPYARQMKAWMWSWTYSPAEARRIIEAHGYFRVTRADTVITPEEDAADRLADERQAQMEAYEQQLQALPPGAPVPPPPLPSEPPPPSENPPFAYMILAERLERGN